MSRELLPDLLATAEVCERYGCSERAARRAMHQAGAFEIAGKLWVRAADLDRLELEKTEAPPAAAARRTGRARRPVAAAQVPLSPNWRRDAGRAQQEAR